MSLIDWPLDEHVVVRALTTDDAPTVFALIDVNREHLRPWMPWANPESADPGFQRRRLAEAELQWSRAADFGYGLFASTAADAARTATHDRLIGAFGLSARRGPRTLEIGYWLSAVATGRGLATRATEALTDIAANQPDIDRVLVYCDEANHASAAIPDRLGYRLDRVVAVPAEAAAETGRQLEWVVRPDEWRARRSS